jgi:hypothetical protein
MSFSIRVSFGRNPSANTAGYLTVVGDMPALTGSEKQIKWAEDLRAEKARELAEFLAKGLKITLGVVQQSDVSHIAKVEAELDAGLATPQAAPIVAAMAKVFGRAAATYWIDNRSRSARSMVEQAARQ